MELEAARLERAGAPGSIKAGGERLETIDLERNENN
jgi:hypothetical protein